MSVSDREEKAVQWVFLVGRKHIQNFGYCVAGEWWVDVVVVFAAAAFASVSVVDLAFAANAIRNTAFAVAVVNCCKFAKQFPNTAKLNLPSTPSDLNECFR